MVMHARPRETRVGCHVSLYAASLIHKLGEDNVRLSIPTPTTPYCTSVIAASRQSRSYRYTPSMDHRHRSTLVSKRFPASSRHGLHTCCAHVPAALLVPSPATPCTVRRARLAQRSPTQPNAAQHSPTQPNAAHHSPTQPNAAQRSPTQPIPSIRTRKTRMSACGQV